jgi:hypothetical protein
VRGERLDPRADLYSLGAVAYAAFTGQAPHGVASLGAVMQIEKPPPSMTTHRADIPDAIDVVVRRALEPDRDKRWPDLDSFLNALAEAHATGHVPTGLVPAAAMPPPAPPGRVDQETALATDNQPTVAKPARGSGRGGVIAVLAAVVLAAAGGYGGYQLVLSRPVTVESDGLSVKVPRAWSEKAENATGPALLVSTDTSTWQTSPETEGVYVGVVKASALPTTSSAPPDCKAGSPDKSSIGSVPIVTFNHACDQHPSVVEQYRQLNNTTLLRIQVRDDNQEQRAEVLNSASYTPSGN